MTNLHPLQYLLQDNGIFPNSPFPVLFYKSAFRLSNDRSPKILEETFARNHWTNSWRDGVYTYNHYHSTSHEVLGIYSGDCHFLLGGNKGIQLLGVKGDVIVIPAGVSHKNIGSTLNFKCVGAYPDGRDFDINLGKAGERPQADINISKVPLPAFDPLHGKTGPLLSIWIKIIHSFLYYVKPNPPNSITVWAIQFLYRHSTINF